MNLIEWPVPCPYCGEENTLLIDPSVEEQDYIEDCQICCQPMRVRVAVADGVVIDVDATREND